MASTQTEALRVGYVPGIGPSTLDTHAASQLTNTPAEHFSTPLHLAQQHNFYGSTTVSFHPFPSGTGHMIQSLRANEIDVAIGLTEGWIAGIKGALKADWYRVIGGYVSSPLCWAISTGAGRDVTVPGLKDGAKVGISRYGSGSHIMSFVLAQQNGWLQKHSDKAPSSPFEFIVLNNFQKLRDAVNGGGADVFMWEHFTSKKFYDSGEIARIGEIYTPWPSWLITARAELTAAKDARLAEFMDGVNKGIALFKEDVEQGIAWITANLEYSEADAREWRKGVKFVDNVKVVDPRMVESVVNILKEAGVVEQSETPDGVIASV
ncbi:hypothetical protein Dda_8497 [Drechslerella dactyloides]|uniref:Ca3427-like PBP 2 domain-containing protein n=1 Tax=Drechslerella dactyloides TaxID=74499 RepID=A0AAD6IUE7_DREDA|nr:hypothetical protein Dda_8497 [Drechslerella dactyloides]